MLTIEKFGGMKKKNFVFPEKFKVNVQEKLFNITFNVIFLVQIKATLISLK